MKQPMIYQSIIRNIYDEAAYDLSINYTQPPPPPEFSEADIQWMQANVLN